MTLAINFPVLVRVPARRNVPAARFAGCAAPVGSAGVAHPPAPVHLTQRGRAVVAGVLALVAFGAFWVLRPVQTEAPRPSAPAVVTVHTGDTLWSIATAVAPARDTRDVVADLMRINGLDSPVVWPGQALRTS